MPRIQKAHRERAPHGSGATNSRDVFRAVSKDGAGRGRPVASVLASVSDGISDVATAVCIRQAIASIGEGASARPALPPRSPRTTSGRLEA
jgi:hypothetical protein